MTASTAIGEAASLISAALQGPECRRAELPNNLKPDNLARAYAIQEAVCGELGAFGGWEICRPRSEAALACAPLPLAAIRPAPARVLRHGAEVVPLAIDVCFRLGRNLPDYDAPYTRSQVMAAIESCHPGLVVLQSSGRNAGLTGPLVDIAESCGHRLLILGKPAPSSPRLETGRIAVEVQQGGELIFSGDMGLADDPIDRLLWLANRGARWDGGLMVSQWIAIRLDTKAVHIHTNQPTHVTVGALGSIDLQCV